jgi:hypothetical protein
MSALFFISLICLVGVTGFTAFLASRLNEWLLMNVCGASCILGLVLLVLQVWGL